MDNPETIIDDLLSRRLQDVLPSKEAFKERLLSGKKITIYQGFDPSSPNLHIGHLVGLLTLKAFQELGHQVIFLIGDFTGMIGDPTGKAKARQVLTQEIVAENAKTYQTQAELVLRFSGENPIQLKYNSEWNKKLNFEDVIRLSHHFTVQQMIERDMFQERLNQNQEIYLNEFLYPLVQGYDSVAMEVDAEMGGNDQLFNMMAGRKLVKELLHKEKFVVTTPLLADASGKKIGKTEGNAINIANAPEEFFGQMMSLPDSAILPCFKYITLIPSAELTEIEHKISKKPMEQKKRLAWELVAMLHDQTTADQAQTHFEKTVQAGEAPQDIPQVNIDTLPSNPMGLVDLLVALNMAESKSAARRLIIQKAVHINDQLKDNPQENISLTAMTIKVGKRQYLQLK